MGWSALMCCFCGITAHIDLFFSMLLGVTAVTELVIAALTLCVSWERRRYAMLIAMVASIMGGDKERWCDTCIYKTLP